MFSDFYEDKKRNNVHYVAKSYRTNFYIYVAKFQFLLLVKKRSKIAMILTCNIHVLYNAIQSICLISQSNRLNFANDQKIRSFLLNRASLDRLDSVIFVFIQSRI